MIKPWNKLSNHYLDSNKKSFLALADLCQKIFNNEFPVVVYGWNSMWDLCISQNEVTYPYDGPYLNISPISANELEFRYVDTQVKTKQRVRVYSAEEYENAFRKFIEELHWIVKYEN